MLHTILESHLAGSNICVYITGKRIFNLVNLLQIILCLQFRNNNLT